MARFIANLLVLAMATVLILFAVESDSILQYFGYGFGVLMFIAVLVNWHGAAKNRRDA